MTRKKIPSAAGSQGKAARALWVGTTVGIALPGIATAGPEGGVVTAGQGSISNPNGTSTVINQSSNSLSIDWQSFDLASNESVSFLQPGAGSVALNRILDQKPSEIFGRIDANGKVILLNSHGIMFGAGAQLNVGSLLASSLNVISFDESTGRLSLAAGGTPGAIVNHGTITAGQHGSVSLVGGSVTNSGLIVAEYGTVNLAAGKAATLDFYGGGLLRFDADAALDSSGGALAGVSNAGQIHADGGQVLLTTRAAQDVFDRAVNNDGVVRANRIDDTGGVIRLLGGDTGTVTSSGVLDASGVGAGSTGGSVHVLGRNVGLFGSALVDVSGDAGGGVALIGGDFQGKNPEILNARRTIVAPGASIDADARIAGDGGRVIVWADEATSFYGGISTRGGSVSGDGGFVEVSGKDSLAFDGQVALGAANGAGGSLLLDPENIDIQTASPNATPNLLFAGGPTNANVTPASIVTALNGGDVLLQATDDITIENDISAAGSPVGNELRLEAGDNITLEDNVNVVTGGPIVLRSGVATPVSVNGSRDVEFLTGSSVTAPSIEIEAAAGNIILLVGTVNATGSGTVTLTALGDISDGTAASVTAGTLVIDDADDVDLHTAVGTLDISGVTDDVLIDDTGNTTITRVNAGGDVQIDSGGAILDDDAGTTSTTTISGSSVTLNAVTGVGAVDNLRLGTGSSIDVNTAGNLAVTVDSNAGEINLNLVQVPVLAAGGIHLGTDGGDATGEMLIQSANNLDVSAFTDNAITLGGGGNTASVGFRSAATLTLPTDANDPFDNGPSTLAVTGNDVIDEDGQPRELSFTFDNLIFDSNAAGGNPTLTGGDIGTLRARVAGGAALTVAETNAITLTDVVSDGALNVTATGAITAGVVQSVNSNVTLASSAGAITDDGDPGTRTRISGNAVSLSGTSIGAAGGNNDIDTSAQTLLLNATTGGIVLLEQNAANITAFASASNTQLETENGALTSTDDLQPTAGSLQVISRGAGVNVDYSAIVLGRTVTPGAVTVRAGGNLTVGEVNSSGGALEAGFSQATGDLVINDVAGGTGNVELRAAGTITDNAAANTAALTADTLVVTRASSVDLDTAVDALDVTGVSGALTIRERAGALTVADATVGGAIDISTVNGSLNVVNAEGTGIALNAGGAGSDIILGLVDVSVGDASLTASGDIDDGAGNTPSVIADQLTIRGGGTVDLDTDLGTLDANGMSSIVVRERVGGLAVADASATGAVSVATLSGAMTVTTVNGTNVALEAGGTGALTLGTVTGTNVALSAGGAITDAAGATPSVVAANQLTVANAGSVNLDTDAAVLDASSIAGALTVREQSALDVQDATATGAVNVSTVNGALSVTNANGNGVTLAAGGAGSDLAITLANANGGTALLSAAGDITGAASAVRGTTLNITQATNVNVGTQVANLDVINVTGNITVDDATGNLTVARVNSSGGAVSLTSAGSLLDDDQGTSQATNISGTAVTLTAASGIGSVTNFTTGAGSSVDVDTNGVLQATVASDTGAINLNIAGAPTINANGISLGAGAGVNGTVLLQSGADLDLQGLTPGAISIGDAANAASVGFVSGGMLTLRDTGSVTNFAPANVLVSGADVVAGASASRTIALTANTLNFNASAAGGAFTLNTDVDTLNANVGNVGLNVVQNAGAGNITLGDITSQSLTVDTVAAGGAILDDGNDSTVLTGASVSLSAGGAIGSNASAVEAIDVDTPSLFAASYGAGGDVVINSVRTGSTTFYAGAGVDNLIAGNGDLIIRAQGDVSSRTLYAPGDTVSVSTSGQLVTDPAVFVGQVVVADDLAITAASGVNLVGTNINTLSASNVAGPLSLSETSGPLTVANAGATGAINIATVNGALNVTNAASSGGMLTLAAGGTGALTIGTASGAAGVSVSTNDGALSATTLTSSAGAIVLGAGGTGTLTLDTANAAGAITATTANGALDADSVTSTGGAVSLTAGGSGVLTAGTVDGVGASLTSGGALTISSVDANTGTATLAAAGAITDGAGTTASVTANQLTITAATSVDLDTDVGTLNASGVTGALTVRERLGALAVTNASATGAVNVSTINGAMNVTNAASTGGALTLAANGGALTVTSGSGTGAALSSTGAITLGTLNAGAGTATLTASGAITDAAGAAPSVVANQLTITGGTSADLDTDVNSLTATGLTGTLAVREQTGALTVTNAAANGAVNVATTNGALTVTSAASTAGAVTLTAGGGGALNVGTATGTGATLTGGAMTLGTVDVDSGNVTLAATGAISDAAGPTASIEANQLTITSAASANLDTNVNTLNATGVTGALTVREQTGALAVTNASAAGAVNVSTVNGALTVTNAASTGGTMTLAAGGGGAVNLTTAAGATGATVTGGAVTVGMLNAGTGAASLTATGALNTTTVSGTGATLSGTTVAAGSVNAGTGALSITSPGAINLTSGTGTGATLNAGGALTAGTVSSGSAALNLTSTGALTLTTGSGGSATLNSGATLTLGTLGVGAGTASLTAAGALGDDGTTTALTAGATTLSAASIGSASNPFNTSITSLTSNSTSGGTYVRDAGDILLTNMTAATDQDIYVGAIGDITVSTVSVNGSNGNGRVLLAAGSDLLSTGVGTNITAQDVELRAGGLDRAGGRAGAGGNILRIAAPQFVTGSNGSDVPSVVLIQSASATQPNQALFANQVLVVSGNFEIATVTLNPDLQTQDGYLTTRFSDRTAGIGDRINFNNPEFPTANEGTSVLGNINQNALSNASEAASGQGDAVLYVDWASFDPNVSLFGTVNPPICLPRDQQDEDTGDLPQDAPETGAGSGGGSGCASTTAQYDNESLGLPELRLVLTGRGMEWVRVRLPSRGFVGPLRTAQSR